VHRYEEVTILVMETNGVYYVEQLKSSYFPIFKYFLRLLRQKSFRLRRRLV
jgi:hypothetical protein